MKTLSDLDPNYRLKLAGYSNEEKLDYCFMLIDQFHHVLNANKNYLSERVKNTISELIHAAQKEIKMINNAI